MGQAAGSSAALEPVSFAGLPAWDGTEAAALIAGVARHVDPAIRARAHEAGWLGSLAPLIDEAAAAPRRFVETRFRALRIAAPGFLTGYYEPVIPARRARSGAFTTPIHRRPSDLVRVNPPRADLPGDGTFGRLMADGSVGPYHDRAAIRRGALDGCGLELAFVADPVDAFFAQVQGSARLSFEDGSTVRIGYHGRTGHPYTAIGRVLIDRGVLPEGGATMATIRAALAADPALVEPVLSANRSYVFFRERISMGEELGPVAAAGLALVPWRSLAVDRAHIAFGTPVHVATRLPDGRPFAAVMIAEDTGSAIVGPARGDVFTGSGDAAGALAGAMKSPAVLTLVVPEWAA